MIIRAFLKTAAACAIMAAATSQCFAAVVTYTYSGIVDYGYDDAGIFGSSTNLIGEAFTLVETFDTTAAYFRYASDGAQSLQYGGLTNGAPNSASLTVTIGGQSRSILDLWDYVFSASSSGKHLDFVKDSTGYEYGGFYVQSTLMPADYAQPMSINGDQGLFIGNYQYFSTTDSTRNTYASFDVSNLTVTNSAITPVPLPSTLPLFGTALFGLWAFAYGRKRRASAATQPQTL